MGNAVSVVPGAGFTAATTTLSTFASDQSCIVTFTTATTIPGSPFLLFTLTWGGSWAATYPDVPAILAFPCASPVNGRTQAQMAAVAALGPFYIVPSINNTTAQVYCTNAPAISTAYDIGVVCIPLLS
jgi:hypothetical protein